MLYMNAILIYNVDCRSKLARSLPPTAPSTGASTPAK